MQYPRKCHKHIRLPGNDHTRGAYFVTLCTDPRRELVRSIIGVDGGARIDLNDMVPMVDECWRTIPDHFAHVRLDQTQIMPVRYVSDHLHAILVLNGVKSTQGVRYVSVDATGASRTVGARPQGPVPGSPGAIIGAFRSVTTKRINANLGRTGATVWQDGYHERAIRRQGGEYKTYRAIHCGKFGETAVTPFPAIPHPFRSSIVTDAPVEGVLVW